MAFRTFTLGRSSKADIRIEHKSVSRNHAELTVTDKKKLFLIDCQSRHGTYIKQNGVWKALKHGYLSISDKVKVGKVEVDLTAVLLQLRHAENFKLGGTYTKSHEDSLVSFLVVEKQR